MTDVHSKEQRSRNMSRIRSGNTRPELIVRSLVHRLGARFRLRVKSLPGTPDIVMPGRRKVIFVNGCFWHCHDCRFGTVQPATNVEFWREKRQKTKIRDMAQQQALRDAGWDVLVVWECLIRESEQKLVAELRIFLGLPEADA
jgi:DNA mismatch endonuclease (patch repair protein)